MSTWVAAHPYLSILALLVLAGSILAFLYHRSNEHYYRANQPAVGRATVVQQPDVARHRAGAVRDEKPTSWSPLEPAVRQGLAPTFHDDPEQFLPAGPGERTGRLTPPTRDDDDYEDMRQTLRHLAANEKATDAQRALAQGLLNAREQEVRDVR